MVGAGAVGARIARQLTHDVELDDLLICDRDRDRSLAVSRSLGDNTRSGPSTSDVRVLAESFAERQLVVLATAGGSHGALASAALAAGASVVSTADSRRDVESLMALSHEAEARGLTIVAGAGFSPGFSCLLVGEIARHFDRIDEIHVAHMGTGGPDCARQHHLALSGEAVDWVDGTWARRSGGSGRELNWFPDPIGGQDCYRAGLGDSILLHAAFPEATRVTARLAATRRDRITGHLPMLRPPHPEGLIGGLRVEVRGWKGEEYEVEVRGAIDRPASAAGVLAGLVAARVVDGRIRCVGTHGVAELGETLPLLRTLSTLGVRAAVFEGSPGF